MRKFISSIIKASSSFLSKTGDRSGAPARAPQPIALSPAITVLALPGSEPDRQLLEEMARRHRWSMSFAPTSSEARELLKRTKPQIILIDRDIDGTDWRFAVSSFATESGGACVLLISRVVDDYLWNEVVTNGGYDVIRKPLSESEVLRNVRLAWSYWSGIRQAAAPGKK